MSFLERYGEKHKDERSTPVNPANFANLLSEREENKQSKQLSPGAPQDSCVFPEKHKDRRSTPGNPANFANLLSEREENKQSKQLSPGVPEDSCVFPDCPTEAELLAAAEPACRGLPAVPARVLALVHPDERAEFAAVPSLARAFVESLVERGAEGICEPVVTGITVAGVAVLSRNTAAVPPDNRVRCGDCAHFRPQGMGIGSCAVLGHAVPGRMPAYPNAPRICRKWRDK